MRILGLVMFVLVMWGALELHSQGMENAFGGVLGDGTPASPIGQAESAAEAFEDAYDASTARVDRALAQ